MNAIEQIDAWFQQRCDGVWEHQKGVTISTADNPGWIAAFDQKASNDHLRSVTKTLRQRWRAECISQDDKVKVFAAFLPDCLNAAAYVLSSLSEGGSCDTDAE